MANPSVKAGQSGVSTSISAGRFQAVITPSDTVDLSDYPRALYVGTGGDLAFIAAGDAAAVTWKNVPDGFLVPMDVRRVLATGTTAADIVAIF